MNSYFLDTNIIVDLLGDRKPFSQYAKRIFEKAEKGEISLYTSSHSIATCYYILKKYTADTLLRDALAVLMEMVQVLPVTESIIKAALQSGAKDLEDGIQALCAFSNRTITAIITRDLKDFQNLTSLSVLHPENVLI